MEDDVLITELAGRIMEIFRSGGTGAASLIETHLVSSMQGLSPSERIQILDSLHSRFSEKANPQETVSEQDSHGGADVYAKIFSLLLGKKVQQKDLSSQELLGKLAESLKTIFDVLNDLLNATNAVLLCESAPDETIRHVIGMHLSGENQTKSLEKYLGQIKLAILSSHEAYKDAITSKVRNVLYELSPRRMEEKCGKGLRFGALRKAELYDAYEMTFEAFTKWIESGEFMKDFMSEFEKAFQRRLSYKGSEG